MPQTKTRYVYTNFLSPPFAQTHNSKPLPSRLFFSALLADPPSYNLHQRSKTTANLPDEPDREHRSAGLPPPLRGGGGVALTSELTGGLPCAHRSCYVECKVVRLMMGASTFQVSVSAKDRIKTFGAMEPHTLIRSPFPLSADSIAAMLPQCCRRCCRDKVPFRRVRYFRWSGRVGRCTR